MLGNFSKEELTKIENNFNSIFDIIENFDYEDITNLMSKYN